MVNIQESGLFNKIKSSFIGTQELLAVGDEQASIIIP